MTALHHCPECGAPVRLTVLDGLCPSCVIRRSLSFARVVAIADSPIADRLRLPAFRDHSPSQIGDYELESEIARGGMGIVYRARQVSLDRIVALKLLLSGQFADADQVRRFRAEATAVARLDHAAIVPVYEVNEFEGRHYFSMKLVEGRSLAEAMPKFALPADLKGQEGCGELPARTTRQRQHELARFLATVAHAIHYAHQRGVLHRDLKPGNILLDRSGKPHITDFGLARCVEVEEGITRSNTIFGTPAYMPPEQTEDPRNVTVAADVYSLGAIGYELLTSHPPFEGASPVQTMLLVREQEPAPPRQLEPAVALDFETIILKCLQKEPAKRYATALELAEDLDRFAEGEPILARPVGAPERVWRWARRHPAIAALTGVVGVLLLVTAIGGPVMAFRIARERDRTSAANLRATEQLRGAVLARARAERLSGEVNRREPGLAAVRAAAATHSGLPVLKEALAQLARFDVSNTSSPLERGGRDLPVAFRHDFSAYYRSSSNGAVSAYAAVHADNPLPLWISTNSEAGRVTKLQPSPDNQHLAVVRGGRLDMLRVEDGFRLWSREINDLYGFAPDGSWLMVQDSGTDRDLKRLDSASGRELSFAPRIRPLPQEFALASDPALPVFAVLKDNRVELFNWQENRNVGWFGHSGTLARVVWFGHRLAAADGDGNIVVWTLPSGHSKVLRGHRAGVARMQFVPNSPYLFSVSYDGETFCWDADSGDRILASTLFVPEQISPDGQQLMYGTPLRWGWTKTLPAVGRQRFQLADSGSRTAVRRLVFSPDSRLLAVVKQDGVHLIDLARQERAAFVPLLGSQTAFFGPETNRLVVQGRFDVRWFDLLEHEGQWSVRERQVYPVATSGWMQAGSVSPDGRLLLLPLSDGTLEWVGMADGRFVRRDRPAALADAHGAEQGGTLLAFRPADRAALGVLSPATEKPLWLGAGDAVPQFSPDGRWLLASGQNDHQVYRVEGWLPVQRDEVSGQPQLLAFGAGAWTHDSQRLALSVDRDEIVVRRAGSWKEAFTLTTPQPAAVTALAFSPGNRWLAAGTGDGAVELWDFVALEAGLTPLGLTLGQTVSQREAGMVAAVSVAGSPRVQLPEPPPKAYAVRPAEAGPRQIDLTAYYNARLENCGDESDSQRSNSGLGQLPVGLNELDGVTFDVRGIVQLGGDRFKDRPADFPTEVPGVPVASRMDRLHVLGAVVDGYNKLKRPLEVARVRLKYRDGGSRELPLHLGAELEDWWSNPRRLRQPTAATVAWRGLSAGSEISDSYLQLYHAILTNPEPARVVQSLDLISAGETPSPFFVGLTVE